MSSPVWDVTVAPSLTETWIEPTAPADHESHLVQIYPPSDSYALVRLPRGRFEIGRDVACDLTIQDESASRKHAAVEHTPEGFLAIDLESTNGTFVNDTRIQRCILSSGDRLRVGRHVFKFLVDDKVESRFHESVHALATRDGLTGAFNKRYFDDTLAREHARCTARREPLTLVIIDLDHFKKVNDTYGHPAGDEVLIEFCRRTRSVLRDDDLLVRLGGEEFAVLLPKTPLKRTRELAEKIRHVVEQSPFQSAAGPIAVTASLGVALAEPNSPPTALVETADHNLYAAKTAGRNLVMG